MDRLEYLPEECEDELFQLVQEIRQHIHQNPELSLKEVNTGAYITAKLKEFGFTEVFSGVGGTGVVAILRGRRDESILLRADIDALPLTEKVALPYASLVPGVMHACGHDANTAILLGAAKSVIDSIKKGQRLNRGIKFVFQPGEENNNNGAAKILADKTQVDILEGAPRVKYCYALHLSTAYPVGKILYKTGAVTANSDRFQIDILGKGGHASTPEQTIDALQIAVNVSSEIFQIRGRSVKQTVPLAISLGELKGGYAPNIISDFCQVTGTVRTVTNADRDLVLARIKSIGDTHATLFKASVTFTQFPGLRIVTNDRKLEKPVRKALSKAGSLVEPGPSLRSEDFYNFSEARPSAYFAIGAALPGAYEDGTAVFPSHTSTYQIDEGSLLVGVKAWLNILNDWQVNECWMDDDF